MYYSYSYDRHYLDAKFAAAITCSLTLSCSYDCHLLNLLKLQLVFTHR